MSLINCCILFDDKVELFQYVRIGYVGNIPTEEKDRIVLLFNRDNFFIKCRFFVKNTK